LPYKEKKWKPPIKNKKKIGGKDDPQHGWYALEFVKALDFIMAELRAKGFPPK
jgi:hypothetical protein